MWLAFLNTLDDVLQLYIYKDRYLPKESLQLDDFRFRVDRVECHFFLIFCTNLKLSLLLLIHVIKTKNRNHLINKVKNLGYARRLIDEQPRQVIRLLQFFIRALSGEFYRVLAAVK